ncbi:MAG: energy-coupling factor transporter transmembrane component T [Candidatus Nanopelagicales bacterium]|nr:energy-coupling factor transporter transmembrane component T [Candidatus Nanopelagicales bacterium]
MAPTQAQVKAALQVGSHASARWLHPGAWWIWALGLAAAASRTLNPLLLVLIISVAALVVHVRKPDAPWARSFMFFFKLGIAIIVIRIFVQVLFGAAIGQTTLFTLPSVILPEWMAGVRLGGPVTFESILMAFYDGLRLATIIICIGAANSLASPSRLLKSVPAALYEIGVSVVVALTFTPKLVADVSRVQSARHLRGRVTRGPRAIAGAAMPVLEGALEGSVTLAAAMDSRGYGRRNDMSVKAKRTSSALLVVGLIAACIGTYGLVAATSPMVLSAPMLIAGVVVSLVAITRSAQSAVRTRYRPDPWWTPEWLVTIAGISVAMCFIIGIWIAPGAMETSIDPAAWPELPLIPLAGLLIAVTPALTAPPIPRTFVDEPRQELQSFEVAA